jgi:hypothetical protein
MELTEQFDPRWNNTMIPADHWHFHRRLLERYGVVLRPGDFSAIRAAIRSEEAMAARRRAGGTVFAVRVKGLRKRIYVVACGGGRLLAVLPPC